LHGLRLGALRIVYGTQMADILLEGAALSKAKVGR